MKAIIDHQTSGERLKQFLLPPGLVWLLYFLIASILLVILNIHPVGQFMARIVLGDSDPQIVSYSLITDPIFSYIDRFGTSIFMLLWGLFGCAIFTVVSTVQRLIKLVRKEVKESHYLVGGFLPNSSYWHSTLRSDLVFLLLAILWMAYLIFYFSSFLRWISYLLVAGLNSGWHDSYKVLASFLANTLAFYVFIKITHLLSSSWSEIRPDN